MMRLRYIKVAVFVALVAAMSAGVVGCFGYNMMGIPLFSMKIEVKGPNNAPLVGAVVSCSSGETVTVDTSGVAKLNFSDVGPYYISVRYQDNIIASYNVSMPSDGGKTLTANYVPGATPSAGEGAGGNNYFAMMGARLYPLLFQYVFNAYGYSIDLSKYQPGQYTEWQISTNGEKQFSTRKAYLTKLPNGQEWWQVSFQANKDSMLMEVLFSDKQQSIRRMRAKFGSEAPKEVPVTEGWYTSPMQLTPESIEGSVVKKGVSVTVPAGTFTCDQLEFGVAQGFTLRMWRTSDVPGGVVKYEMSGDNGKDLYSGELKSFGTGATTELGSY
ncbi:MAG: hypothetical protein M1470_14565 [Bacteroidetes bacterium]|nr:hypothetical protein [Bacteroidota bacterium]MCL5738393.1 hypothetical protein [Bacteroidota bacterium]